MTVRQMCTLDKTLLDKWAAESPFPYPGSPRNIETCLVVCSENGTPMMACSAQRIVELYLYRSPVSIPEVQIFQAIRLLDEHMQHELRSRGYNEANVFLPPGIEKSFGRTLVKRFGWFRNWVSFAKGF